MQSKKATSPQIILKGIFVILLLSYLISLSAQFAGGNGSQNNPWQIGRAEDLNQIRNFIGAEHSDKYFIQTSNIDLDQPPWNEGDGWRPFALSSFTAFQGNYDGGGHTISGLRLTSTNIRDYTGFFGFVENASIKDVGFEDAIVRNAGYRSGTLASRTLNSIVSNVYVTGRFNASARNQIGGFIGLNQNSQIMNCWADIEFITAGSWNGGFIGVNMGEGMIANCFVTGIVTSTNDTAQNIGGFAGMNSQSLITNCYSTVTMTIPVNVQNVGGLVGNNAGTVTYSYAAGRIIAGETGVGGLNGVGTGAVTNSYWDTEVSGLNVSAGGFGRATRQMTYPYDNETYIDWNFTDIWDHDSRGNVNNGYPILFYQEVIIILDIPEVTADKVSIDDVQYIRISWQSVEDALSYKVFASSDAYAENWGDPIAIVGEDENQYLAIVIENDTRFFYVVASIFEAP